MGYGGEQSRNRSTGFNKKIQIQRSLNPKPPAPPGHRLAGYDLGQGLSSVRKQLGSHVKKKQA